MKLVQFTELAVSLLHGKLPDVVWLPPHIRRQARITPEGVITKNDPDAAEQLRRITQADPLGFLIALMNGQPVVTFKLRRPDELPKKKSRSGKKPGQRRLYSAPIANDHGYEVIAEFHVPSLSDRERAALYLSQFIARERAQKKNGKEASDSADFDAMIANAAAQAEGDGSGE